MATIKLRRMTDAARLALGVVAQGEPIWTTDTKKLYIGDGVTVGGEPVDKAGGATVTVENSLTSASTGNALSAAMGKSLSDAIAAIEAEIAQSSSGLTEQQVTALINGALDNFEVPPNLTLATLQQHLDGTATDLATNPAGVKTMIAKQLSDWLATQSSPFVAAGELAAPNCLTVATVYSHKLNKHFVILAGYFGSHIYSTNNFSAFTYLGSLPMGTESGVLVFEYNGHAHALVAGDYFYRLYRLENVYSAAATQLWQMATPGGSDFGYGLNRAVVGVGKLLVETTGYNSAPRLFELDLTNYTTVNLPTLPNNTEEAVFGGDYVNGYIYYAEIRHIDRSTYHFNNPRLLKRNSGGTDWDVVIANYRNISSSPSNVFASVLVGNIAIQFGINSSSSSYNGLYVVRFDLTGNVASTEKIIDGIATPGTTRPSSPAQCICHDNDNIYVAARVANTVFVKRVSRLTNTSTTIALIESPINAPALALFIKSSTKLGLWIYNNAANGTAKLYEVLK